MFQDITKLKNLAWKRNASVSIGNDFFSAGLSETFDGTIEN